MEQTAAHNYTGDLGHFDHMTTHGLKCIRPACIQ